MQKIEVEIQKNVICQVRAPCISEGDVGSAFKRKLALSFSLRQPKVSLICKEKQAPRPFYQTIECGSSKQSHHLHFRQVKPSISQCQTFFILALVLDYWFIALASNLVKYCTHSALCAEQMGGGGVGGHLVHTSLPSHLKSEIGIFWWLPSYLTQSLQSHFSTTTKNIQRLRARSIVNLSKLLRPFLPALDTVRNVVSG